MRTSRIYPPKGTRQLFSRVLIIVAFAYAVGHWCRLILMQGSRTYTNVEFPPESSWSNYLHHNKLIYEKMLFDRKERLAQVYGGDLNAVIPFDGAKETYLWDFFPPAYNCPFRERIGRFSDGGKVVCNWQALLSMSENVEGCIIYSFGVRDETSFEEELADLTNCGIYAFDPTVPSLPSTTDTTKIIFERVGLGASESTTEDGYPLQDLGTIMKQKGHKRIHLLKVDCDGCEWDSFGSLEDSRTLDKVDQLLIELHFKQTETNVAGTSSGVHEVFKFFELCEKSGLLPFSWEINQNPSGHFSQKPWAIEYSFIRPDSSFMARQPEWIPQPLRHTKSDHHASTVQVSKSKSAIVILCTGFDEDISNLKQNLYLLGAALPSSTAPIVLFHEGDITPNLQEDLIRSTMDGGYKGEVIFEVIKLDLPPKCCDFEPNWQKRTKFGYHNMIRFWMKDIWNHPAIINSGYETIMRLDTDSRIETPQPADDPIPDLLPNLLYRGNIIQYELMPVIDQFAEFLNYTLKSFTPQNPKLISEFQSNLRQDPTTAPAIYTNFFIGRVEFFRRKSVQKLIDLMCCTAPNFYIYRYRWGDNLLHLFLLAMEANETEYVIQPPAGYHHAGQ